ncbi:hypothetical protein A4G19_14980 [Pasteurellaceae bacterium Macca]|nr:hypothetical protein [Pasteurellaceae bacterium Macca]
MKKYYLIAFMSFNLAGCGTIWSLSSPAPQPYSGVRADLNMLETNEAFPFNLLAIIDLPLSFLADTLFLPYTLRN